MILIPKLINLNPSLIYPSLHKKRNDRNEKRRSRGENVEKRVMLNRGSKSEPSEPSVSEVNSDGARVGWDGMTVTTGGGGSCRRHYQRKRRLHRPDMKDPKESITDRF